MSLIAAGCGGGDAAPPEGSANGPGASAQAWVSSSASVASVQPSARATTHLVEKSFHAPGASAWSVTYVGGDRPDTPDHCRQHSAHCYVVPGSTCATAIPAPCACNPAGPPDLCAEARRQNACSAPFLGDVTEQERRREPAGCCYAPPEYCLAPNVGRVLRDAEGARLTLVRGDDSAKEVFLEAAAAYSFRLAAAELRLVGGPPWLTTALDAAALDEERHAEMLASIAGCEVVAPEATRAPRRRPLGDLAVETFFDACCAETLGAIAMRARAELDQRHGRELHNIADDEERHAEVAWQTLRWLVQRGGDSVRCQLIEAARNAQSSALADERLLSEVLLPCLTMALVA